MLIGRRDAVHDGMSFMAPDVGDFLGEVDTDARAKGLANKAKAEADDAKAAAHAAKAGRPAPPKRRWQDGSQAVIGDISKLRSLRRRFSLDIPVEGTTVCGSSTRRQAKSQRFDFLKLTLLGTEGGCFVFRDFECIRSTGTDPGDAIRWLNTPPRGARSVGAIAWVIRIVGDVSS